MHRKNRTAQSLGILFLLFLFTLASWRSTVARPVIGEPAPQWNPEEIIQGLDGQSYRLEDLRGKVIIIDFWFTTCGPCIRALPHMNSLADQTKDKPVQFLGVTFNSADEVRQFLPENPITFPILIDTHSEIIDTYDVHSFPTVALIAPDGRFLGYTDSDHLTSAVIDKLIAGDDASDIVKTKTAPEKLTRSEDKKQFVFELLIALSDDEAGMVSFYNSGGNIDGMTLRAAIAMFSDNLTPARVVSELPLETKIDLTLNINGDAPRPDYSAFFTYDEVVIASLEQAFSLRIEKTEREIPCLLVSMPNGRPASFSPPTSAYPDVAKHDDSMEFKWYNNRSLATMLEYRLKRPVAWIGDELEPFSATLECDPNDTDSVVAALKEQWGLQIEEGTHLLPVIEVTREDWKIE